MAKNETPVSTNKFKNVLMLLLSAAGIFYAVQNWETLTDPDTIVNNEQQTVQMEEADSTEIPSNDRMTTVDLTIAEEEEAEEIAEFIEKEAEAEIAEQEEEVLTPRSVTTAEDEETPTPRSAKTIKDEEAPTPRSAQAIKDEEAPTPRSAKAIKDEEAPTPKRRRKRIRRKVKVNPTQNTDNSEPGNQRLTYGGKDLILTYHAKCRMGCREISKAEVAEVIREGKINKRKSDPNDRRGCPIIALEDVTEDGQLVRIIVANCDRVAKLVTVIDLKNNYKCDCK